MGGMKMDMYGNGRYCQRCGVELTGLRRKWCPECAEVASKLSSMDKVAREGYLKWCPECAEVASKLSSMDKVAREGYLKRCRDGAIKRAQERIRRRMRLTMEQVAALAKEYDSPYNTYGKLKEYIDRHDSLPPEEFRRGNRKRVDWQGWKPGE